MFGSPGTGYLPCEEEIIISEINYASIPSANSGDWFEIRNIGNSSHDLSGWTVRDSEWNNSFTLPDGLVVEANASGLFNVGGSEVLGRLAFAELIADTMQLDKSKLAGVTTSNAGQAAFTMRPKPMSG